MNEWINIILSVVLTCDSKKDCMISEWFNMECYDPHNCQWKWRGCSRHLDNRWLSWGQDFIMCLNYGNKIIMFMEGIETLHTKLSGDDVTQRGHTFIIKLVCTSFREINQLNLSQERTVLNILTAQCSLRKASFANMKFRVMWYPYSSKWYNVHIRSKEEVIMRYFPSLEHCEKNAWVGIRFQWAKDSSKINIKFLGLREGSMLKEDFLDCGLRTFRQMAGVGYPVYYYRGFTFLLPMYC